jgi:hypothetical protein
MSSYCDHENLQEARNPRNVKMFDNARAFRVEAKPR